MEPDLKQQILSIIAQAEWAYEHGLKPENRDSEGYPYVAGYANAALGNIRQLLEVV